MKLTKITMMVLYTLVVVCIGVATVVEKYHGSTFVSDNIYGAWWFSALWVILVVVALAFMMKQQLYKRFAVMLLHVSFVVILTGALTTHLLARRGTVRLRKDMPEVTYVNKEKKVEHLPFTLTLREFHIVNYPGTDAPLDYQSKIGFKFQDSGFEASDDDEVLVSMNHIGNIDGYRLFQQSYDSDGGGVTLGISYDPYGIAITYTGYLMLLVGIIATLFSRKTQMRSLYRKAMTAVLLLVSLHAHAALSSNHLSKGEEKPSLPVIDKEIAHHLGTIPALYNNRICPLNTVATDFTMKMTGSASWHGYSADEVFFSWMIYYMPWEESLAPTLSSNGERNENAKEKKSADERRAIVEMFYNGQFTKIFPYRLSTTAEEESTPLSHREDSCSSTKGGLNRAQTPPERERSVAWFSPGGQVLPHEIPVKEQFFIKQSMDFLTEAIVTGQRDRAVEIIAKIKLFQREMIGDLLPSETKIRAEIFYNTLRSQKWPVFLALTLSLLLCVMILFGKKRAWLTMFALSFAMLLTAYVTLQLALRWWLSGHVPVSNGPETMLFMAWVILLLTTLLSMRKGAKEEAVLAFGPLVASFCLLVAMLGGNSEITPLMPVLQSPLLSIHVMTVMCAYALFALQMLLGIYVLILTRRKNQRRPSFLIHQSTFHRLTALSQLLLYPAVFLLTIGIFLGAVWANVSWGNYWSWDPKESWALITLMVYAVPLHKTSIAIFRRPRFYHLYMVCAFLAVIITYFGVNYLLGGMHSYA